MPNEQQQQQPGFQSFDDFDKFLKQKPEAPPAVQQKAQPSGNFKDFSDFDSFISDAKKPKPEVQPAALAVPTAKPKKPGKIESPPSWGELPFYQRPAPQWESKAISPEDMAKDLSDRFGIKVDSKNPKLHEIWKDANAQIDPVHHPINFIEHTLGEIHKGIEYATDTSKLGQRILPTTRQDLESSIAVTKAALEDHRKGMFVGLQDWQRKGLEKRLGQYQSALDQLNKDEAKEGVSNLDPGVVARAGVKTFVDWESMGAVFKPLEYLSELMKGAKAGRAAMYAVNQALGAKFSYDSFQNGNKEWEQGHYWDAVREYGGAGAMLVLPLFGHVMSEKNITQDQIREKANEILEDKKQELETKQRENPNAVLPVTPKAVADLQWRLANGMPFQFGIGRPEPADIPMPDASVLRVGEEKAKSAAELEELKTAAQARISDLHQQQRDLDAQKKAAVEGKTEAEKHQILKDLDAKQKKLDEDFTAEKARFRGQAATIEKPEEKPMEPPPVTEKRPSEAEAANIPGRPLTREEREDQWLEERRKRYTDQLAAEREQRLRTGQEFKFQDLRRVEPGTPPLEPSLAPMQPPPRIPEEVRDKIAAAALENMELEAQKGSASAQETVAIDKRQEENRELAGDIAQAIETRKLVDFGGEKLEGPVGKLTELKTVTQNYPVRYRVVEGSKLRTSHDPINFEVNEKYPAGVQERDYAGDRDAQLAVIQHTQGYDPSFTLSDSPGPEHGPPMVTSDGVVLGGNSRAMSTMRLYKEEGALTYRQALLDRASQLGLDPKEIEEMKEPVLVRELLSLPKDVQGMRALGSDMNRVFTRKLSEYEQAVSAGKRLSQATLDFILHQLTELGEGASLRDLLRERSKGILEKLEADGVIATTERRQFIEEKTGALNEAGKDFVENAILGSVIDDPLVLANAPKGALKKIERSLSSIAKVKARGGSWDITDYVKEALREHIAAASKGIPIEEHIDPPTALLFAREKIHPIIEGVALKLAENSAEVKKAFDDYAEDAEKDVRDQGTMAFFEPPTPWKSFSENFGVDVKPEEWGTVKAPAVLPKTTPTGVVSQTAPVPLTSPEEPQRVEPPAKRELERLDPGPKKKSEFLDDVPTRTIEESVKTMADDDLRVAAKTIESQKKRKGITAEARKQIEEQTKPIKEEMDRRQIDEKPKAKFGEKNTVFTKERAESARDRLRKKIAGTTVYAGIDPELVRDVAEVMGYYFEGGIREFPVLSAQLLSEFGDAVKPLLKAAFDHMQGVLKKEEPRIILPPGVEREERTQPVTSREKPDAGARPKERERTGQDVGKASGSTGGVGEQASGRAVRSPRTGATGPGVVERFEQPLRNTVTPKIDAEHITDIPYTEDPTEWKKALKDANLPENLPPPTETISPEVDRKLIFKGQPEIVKTVLTSLRKYHGAIMATSTGTGKTFTGSAIIKEMNPRLGLVLAPSKNIAQQWIDTAKTFGVEIKMLEKDIPTEPGVYTTTYSTATNRKGLDKMNFNLVIADESHYARRWHDEGNKRGKFLINVGKASDNVLYTSATPFHTPLELGYFEKLGLWKKTGLEPWLKNEFGVRQDSDGKWVVPMNFRKLAALREELISRGMFVNLDRDMDGYTANFSVVPMDADTQQGARNATKAFRLAEDYFKSKNLKKMIMAVRGNATTFMKSYLERQRLPQAIELGKKLENEGWKVVYFTESKKEVDDIYDFLKPADEMYGGAISQNLPKLPNVVDKLKEAFGENLADFTGAHSARRQSDLEAFNSGEKKHLVATYGAGGVGVSLHDLSGEAPRAVIYLGPPWSGVMFDQAIGRPWRFGTKSNVNAYFLTSNAQPEMKLVFQKVLPRFESLKASVSGIKKEDPIVSAMKDLDSYLAYDFGNDTSVGYDQFMNTLQTGAVSSYKEAPINSAEDAKNKGMQVARRVFKELVHGESGEFDPSKLFGMKRPEESAVPEDLRGIEDSSTRQYEESLDALRRMFVPEQAKRDISDPRLLDKLNDENMKALGMDPGKKPPRPPSEDIGTKQIPRPGEANVRQDDLATPKVMQRAYEWAEDHFGEWKIPTDLIDRLAGVERNIRLGLAKRFTAPSVLSQFPHTKGMVEGILTGEKNYRRELANKQYDKAVILKKYNLENDPIGRRKVDQALRLVKSDTSIMSLLGQPTKYLDNKPFQANELKAAQEIRDKIFEPIIHDVRAVRPDVGYIQSYSPVVMLKKMENLASTLYPDLDGKLPADLLPHFSLEVQTAMTKLPTSPHTLKRRGEPPRTFDIDEVLDAYMPGMLKVKHYTQLSKKVARQLSEIPPDSYGRESVLKEYATKYARIFFGVPSEYKRMDQIHYKASRTITNLLYSAALEVNPSWFALHLTKVPINSWPELGKGGAGYIAKGYGRMLTPEGRELVARSGILMDKLWVFPDTFSEIRKKPSTWLRLTTSMSDAIDRSASYLAALEKAKDMGFLGPKDQVGTITWERLNQLAAQGIDTEKALDYAHSVISRSEFLYTPANVQMWQHEHPFLGMFQHYFYREADFIASINRIAKEVRSQPNPEAYIQQKVSEGHYEYIDSIAKQRRLLLSLAGATAFAIGIGNTRFFPLHLGQILASPVIFAQDTLNLLNRTLSGQAKEEDWEVWLNSVMKMVPYAAGAMRLGEDLVGHPLPFDARKVTITKKGHHHKSSDFTPVEKYKFDSLPQ